MLKNLISHVGMGKMQVCFWLCVFCIAEKLRCVENVLRRIELQKDEIKKQGLIAGERHYVHLSADEATARKVGARHGSPVILTVKAEEMATRGIPFWQAENGVWLTSTVAVEFLEW